MNERDDFDLKEIGRRAAESAEKEWILKVLVETCWNRKRTARLLQVSYKTLLSKIVRYRLNSVTPIIVSRHLNSNAYLYGRKEI
jgi:DNA-binding NtrC family response regulator